jgi:hypothetical protein
MVLLDAIRKEKVASDKMTSRYPRETTLPDGTSKAEWGAAAPSQTFGPSAKSRAAQGLRIVLVRQQKPQVRKNSWFSQCKKA